MDTTYDWFTYNATKPTNLTVSNTHGLLEISGNATSQEYIDLLSTVYYSNKLEEPNEMYEERNITVTIYENNQSSMAYIIVELIPRNDPARFNFSTNRTIIFDETNREPVMLFKPTDTIVDPDQDGGNLTYATLKLWTEVHEGDTLSITMPDRSSLSVYNNRTYVNISGVAPISDYEMILKTATFVNRRFDSPPDPRFIIINTFDGNEDSLGPNITVNISTTDDPPVCFFGRNSVSFYPL